MGSVFDEVSQLLWPGIERLVLVVVPPVLLIPFVKLNDSWGKEPCEGLKTAENEPETDSEPDVHCDVAAELSSTNNEGNELPEGEHPGEWDDPGDGSVVDFLHEAIVNCLDVGKEPEDAKDPE